MTNDWIIDVLTDLRKFSASNRLGHLAEQLDDTIMIATSEITSAPPVERHIVRDIEQTVRHAGGPVAGDNA